MTEELYQDLIIEYSKKKDHRGSLGGEACHVQVKNPLCGDDIEMWVEVDDSTITRLRFDGYGCMISQASAAILAELAEGSTLEEVSSLSEDFRSLMKGERGEALEERVGDLVALEGVSKLPARLRCALLAFEALERVLKEKREPSA